MKDEKHINLLVLPELFPEFDGDWKGVFIEDYLKSVSSLNVQTLYLRLTGSIKGIKDENYLGQFKLRRYCFSNKRVSNVLKPFLYIFWFFKGIQLGKQYTNTTIIHAHGAILCGTLAYLIGKKLNVPFIVTEHTGPYSRILNSWIKSRISRFVFKKAARVLAVSEHQKKEILKLGIPSEKVEVSYNPVNTAIFKRSIRKESKQIIFVSRLDEFKGGLRTLKAFHDLSNRYNDYGLTIVGDGEEMEAIKTYIVKNNLEHKVELKGTLTKPEISTTLTTGSFFVFPSRHETFGLVVAEALSSGLPVICTNKTAPKEFINSDNGILVDPDNVEEITKAMEQMIQNRASFDEQKIHDQIEERFGLESFGNYLKKVYKEAMN